MDSFLHNRRINCSLVGKVLIIGSSGFLGISFTESFKDENNTDGDIDCFDLRSLSTEAFSNIAKTKDIHTVYYCCGYSNASNSNQHTTHSDTSLAKYVRDLLYGATSIRTIIVCSTALLTWQNPLSAQPPLLYYLQAKKTVEETFKSLRSSTRSVVCIRFSNVFGPNDSNVQRIIPYILGQFQRRCPIHLSSAPSSRINLVYSKSVVREIKKLLGNDGSFSHWKFSDPILAACNVSIRLDELIDLIRVSTGDSLPAVTYGTNISRIPSIEPRTTPLVITESDVIEGLRSLFSVSPL